MMDLELKCKGVYSNLNYYDWFNEWIESLENSKDELTEFEQKFMENKNMIMKSCMKYKQQLQTSEEYSDLIQEGLIILQETIDKYQSIVSGKAVKFSTYLYINLEGGLQAIFNEKFRGIKLTQTAFKNKDTKYVDYFMNNEERAKVIENNSIVELSEDNVVLNNVINNVLNDEEKYILNLYFIKGYKIQEIGEMYSCSKQYISKIKNRIIDKIKKEMCV